MWVKRLNCYSDIDDYYSEYYYDESDDRYFSSTEELTDEERERKFKKGAVIAGTGAGLYGGSYLYARKMNKDLAHDLTGRKMSYKEAKRYLESPAAKSKAESYMTGEGGKIISKNGKKLLKKTGIASAAALTGLGLTAAGAVGMYKNRKRDK